MVVSRGGDEGLAKWVKRGQKVQTFTYNSLQAPMLGHVRPNNQQGRNTAPPISRQAASSLPEPTADPAHQGDKIQLHPPVSRSQSLPPRGLQKSMRPASSTRGRQQKQEPPPCGTETSYRELDRMRQQGMFQMEKHDTAPEQQLREVETGNLLQKEFRVMTVKMF